MKPIRKPDSSFKSSPTSNKVNPFVEVSTPGFTNSIAATTTTTEFGQKRYLFQGSNSVPQLTLGNFTSYKEVPYPAQSFTSNGYFNGFPFKLQPKSNYLQVPGNFTSFEDENGFDQTSYRRPGITQNFATGIYVDLSERQDEHNKMPNHLGGGYPLLENKGYYTDKKKYRELSICSKQYYMLAGIETDFVIKTTSTPNEYEVGNLRHPNNLNVNRNYPLQHVSQDFEVVIPGDDRPLPPHLRTFIEPTGLQQIHGDLDENGLLTGMAKDYTSIFFHGKDGTVDTQDVIIPLTIQPSNTGAFVITLDESVANYFADLAEYGQVKEFNLNMVFDYNTNGVDHEGFARSPVEYHSFPQLAYIVPAAGWDFEVVASKVKGVYYEIQFNENNRGLGDAASILNHRMAASDIEKPLFFSYSLHSPVAFGARELTYNNLPVNHILFDPVATRASLNFKWDVTYADFFKLSKSKTFLEANRLTLTEKQNLKFRAYSDTLSAPLFLPLGGTPGQYVNDKFFYFKNRKHLKIDESVFPLLYQAPYKLLNGIKDNHTGTNLKAHRQPGYQGLPNPYKHTSLFSIPDTNPRKLEDSTYDVQGLLPPINSTKILAKSRDVSTQLPDYARIGSVGGSSIFDKSQISLKEKTTVLPKSTNFNAK